MSLNVERQDDGSFIVDDATDGSICHRIRVSLVNIDEIHIEDLLRGGEITISRFIASGLTAAIWHFPTAEQIWDEIGKQRRGR